MEFAAGVANPIQSTDALRSGAGPLRCHGNDQEARDRDVRVDVDVVVDVVVDVTVQFFILIHRSRNGFRGTWFCG